VVLIPDAVGSEKIAGLDLQRIVEGIFGPRAFDDDRAEHHVVAKRRRREVAHARVTPLVLSAERIREGDFLAVRQVREADLHERAPAGRRVGVEKEVDVAEHERRRARRKQEV
jgi:hypothetical protein